MTRVPSLWVLLAGLALAAGAFVGCRTAGTAGVPVRPDLRAAPQPIQGAVRGIWVARFHYRHREDIETIIRNCAELGCNTVYWQVRGEATLAYPSRYEPWSKEYDHRDPGFDPLAVAVAESRRRGLRIEAWVNVMPGWRGKAPPPVADHVWHARPEWFLQDAAGRRQALHDFYVILNPCLPEVRRHIVRVVQEILERYDVDGIHLDYVRYAWDETPDAERRFPRDPRTLALYRRDTGLQPDDDPARWKTWRAQQLTQLVGEIRRTIDRHRPGATLTAAVIRNPAVGYGSFLQNAVAWLRAGYLDAILPMAYTDKLENFAADVEAYRGLVGPRRVVPGVGLYKLSTPEAVRAQLEQCRRWGGDYALFSYDSLHATRADESAPAAGRERALRLMRREQVRAFNGR